MPGTPIHTTTNPAEMDGALPKQKTLSPKAFWDACDVAGCTANHLFVWIEKAAGKTNEILGIICKWGMALCVIGLALSWNAGADTSFYKETGILYCAGILASHFGESAFGERGFISSFTFPLIAGVMIFTLPI